MYPPPPSNSLLSRTHPLSRLLPSSADFGLSKLENPTGTQHQLRRHITSNLGTPVYMAPELMNADSATSLCSGSIDIYSFGILMYAVLTRKKPYEKMVREKRWNIWALRDAIVHGLR